MFTHVKNGNLGKISVTERSCTAPVFKVESHMLDKCSYYTGGLFVSSAKAIRCEHSLKDAAGIRNVIPSHSSMSPSSLLRN